MFFARKSEIPGRFGSFWGVLGSKKGKNGHFRAIFKARCAFTKVRIKRIFFAQNGRKDPFGRFPDRPLTIPRHPGEIRFRLQEAGFGGQNGLLGRIPNFLEIGLEVARNGAGGGTQGVWSILRMPGMPKSVGLGTLRALMPVCQAEIEN